MLLWFLVSSLCALVIAAPSNSNATCTNPKIRKEWRELTVLERVDYIRAIKCMQSSPPKSKKYFSVVRNRYDDFVALHANSTGGGLKLDGSKGWADMVANPFSFARQMSNGIHGTGTFLPWHRYALSLWEDALRDECGWKGGLAYWDWHRDTPEAGAEWLKSPIFDPVTGFGGNGKHANTSSIPTGMNSTAIASLAKIIPGLDVSMTMGGTGGGCLLDGPFQNQTLSIGPMGQMTPNNTRCLTRSINAVMAQTSANSKSMRKVLSAKSMVEFRQWAENGSRDWSLSMKGISVESYGSMHDIGHAGIGGEMMDLFNSVNDPLFFMHHAGIDRIWSLWQEQDPKRVMDAGGATNFFEMAPLTLDSWVWVGFAGTDRKAVEVMDPVNRDGRGVLCYRYEGNSFESYFK